MQVRHKQQKDENFPVAGLLIRSSLRRVVNAYYKAARYCDDIADSPSLSSQEKIERLNRIESIFLGYEKNDCPKELLFIKELREIFNQESLDTSLFTDLLVAFKQDSRGYIYETWEQLLEYCSYSAAPVGRFMLAIHDENMSTYLPAGVVCAVLQIVNHVQDIKYDATVQNRIYVPKSLLQKFQVAETDLSAEHASENLKNLVNDMCQTMQDMLKDVAVLPSIIRSLRLRMQVCVIFSLTNIMLQKLKKADILQRQVKLSKFDWLKAASSGVFRALFTKVRISGTSL